MRIGIFSGTFDPVHRGHIAFALAAIKQAKLDKVVLMPERSPRGKFHVSDFAHRVKMLRLAVKQHRKLSVLALEEKQFSVEGTLPKLQERYAGAQLVLLLGSDVVRTFGFRWPALDKLLATTELAVSLRAGEAASDIQTFLDELGKPVRATLVEGPHAHVSASEVRSGNLQSIEPLVRAYIEQNALYGTLQA